MTDEPTMRPDVEYTIDHMKMADESYDLAEEEDGFHCHECGWRALSLPMTEGADGIFDTVCPECGEEGVENKLSTHVDSIKEIYEDCRTSPSSFVRYETIQERFDAPQDRLDEALNHLLTRNRAYVVFEKGEALINIQV